MKTFFMFCVLSLSLTSYSYADSNYKIMIDAGSSGSRLHIFKFDTNSPVPSITQVFSQSIKPGLSSFVDDPKASPSYLKQLMDPAQDFMNKQGISLKETSLSLLATAGMRSISSNKQRAIYRELKQFLQHNYPFKIEEIETISGKMEGLYGWLDVNYLGNNFQNHTPTLGSIDMGGASTQIAFATPFHLCRQAIHVTIDKQEYTVVSKSFRRLGQDASLESMMKSNEAAACFPQLYSYQKDRQGNFNKDICASIYQHLLKKNKVEREVSIKSGQVFVAYSGIYHTFNFFGIDTRPSASRLEANIQTLCTENWEKWQHDFPNVPDRFKSSYCANAVYEYELLFNTYKLQDAQLTITNAIDNHDLDWTLGALLYELVASPKP